MSKPQNHFVKAIYASFYAPTARCSPEQDLWLSSLIQAIYSCFNKGYSGKKERKKLMQKYSEEDFRWLTSDDYSPGSYSWLCDACNLDPLALRERLFRDHSKLLPTTAQPQKTIQDFQARHSFGGRKKKPRLPGSRIK